MMALTLTGAAGDGVTDDTAAVQAWVDSCVATGLAGYVPAPAVAYMVTAPINVTGGFTCLGDGCVPFVGDLAATGVMPQGMGSWFYLNHAGIGFNVQGAASISGVTFEKIGTYRNQPPPNGQAYTPGAFDFDFSINEADVLFRDIVLLNPTKGIDMLTAGDGRIVVDNVRGQPLQTGIQITASLDAGKLDKIHFWPFWSNDTGVRTYMKTNGTAIIAYRWDDPDISNCFALGYAVFLRCLSNTYGVINEASIVNCDANEGGWFLLIDTAVNGAALQISNCRTIAQNQGVVTPVCSSIQLDGTNCRVMISNMEMQVPQVSCVRVQGSGNTVSCSNVTLGAWNQSNSGYCAVDAATAGNTIIMQDIPVISLAPTGGTSLYNEASGSTVRATLARGQTVVTPGSNGVATITHNGGAIPRRALVNIGGTAGYMVNPTSIFTSTTFGIQARQLVPGGAPAVTVAVPIYWEVGF